MKTLAQALNRMGISQEALQKSEAKILEMRWGVKWQAILVWMQARGFLSVMDLMAFEGSHSESMDKALADFWEFST